MKKVLIAFVCVVALGVSWRMVRQSLFGVPYDAPLLAPPATAPAAAPVRAQPDPKNGPDPKAWPWQQRAAYADDFLAVVRAATPEAEAGNGDAQFALYSLFRYCWEGMGGLNADERSRIPEEVFKEMHGHCDPLAAEYKDLGGASDRWLKAALESQFPRALAFSSIEDLRAMERGSTSRKQREQRIVAARANLVEALKSNDPAITERVPMVLRILFPDDARTEQATWVWKLAACEQGLDCRPDSMFVRDDCRRRNLCMSGETGQSYVRRVAAEIPSLDERARELARTLRKGEMDDKVFVETVTSLPQPTSDLFAKSRAESRHAN